MYERNRQLPLCVYSVLEETSRSDPWYDQWDNYVHNEPQVNEWKWTRDHKITFCEHNETIRDQIIMCK
jgi:hypothetical protein